MVTESLWRWGRHQMPPKHSIQNLLTDSCFYPIQSFTCSVNFSEWERILINKLQINNTAKMTLPEPVTGLVSKVSSSVQACIWQMSCHRQGTWAPPRLLRLILWCILCKCLEATPKTILLLLLLQHSTQKSKLRQGKKYRNLWKNSK